MRVNNSINVLMAVLGWTVVTNVEVGIGNSEFETSVSIARPYVILRLNFQQVEHWLELSVRYYVGKYSILNIRLDRVLSR